MSTRQKLIDLSALFVALVLAGCTTFSGNHLGVQEKGPHEHMFISAAGHKQWYSALELENEAKRYVKERDIQYDFTAAEMNIWVVTDGSAGLARVSFSSGIGKPSLIVDINRRGRAYSHFLATSVCGFGTK